MPRAPFPQNQYGATVGGPIRQNRTFYFLNWEQTDLRLGTTTTTTVPTAAKRNGDFSSKGLPPIFDPLITGGTANNARARRIRAETPSSAGHLSRKASSRPVASAKRR
jgi:hypothetical protein